MIINLEKYLPLNDTNSIQVLLNDIEQRMQLYNDQEIGQVLMHIKKVKLQLFFRNGIDEINKKTRNSKRKLALERKKESTNMNAENIVYTTHTLYDIPNKPVKHSKPFKTAKTNKTDKTKAKKSKSKHQQSIPKRSLSPFLGESKEDKEKRRQIRERNAKTSGHVSTSTLNERGKSIIPIYIPMGGKRK